MLADQVCADTGNNFEDLPGAIDERDSWRERERESGKFRQSALLELYN